MTLSACVQLKKLAGKALVRTIGCLLRAVLRDLFGTFAAFRVLVLVQPTYSILTNCYSVLWCVTVCFLSIFRLLFLLFPCQNLNRKGKMSTGLLLLDGSLCVQFPIPGQWHVRKLEQAASEHSCCDPSKFLVDGHGMPWKQNLSTYWNWHGRSRIRYKQKWDCAITFQKTLRSQQSNYWILTIFDSAGLTRP